MLRFILNFIFYGILFYIIAHFFPDAFHKLVSWAEQIFAFFAGLFTSIMDWISERSKGEKDVPEKASSALFVLQQVINYFRN